MSQRLSKPFWPPALASQAPPAILLAALRRFRGPALFRGLRPCSSPGAPFWPSGLTLRSSRPAYGGRLTSPVRNHVAFFLSPFIFLGIVMGVLFYPVLQVVAILRARERGVSLIAAIAPLVFVVSTLVLVGINRFVQGPEINKWTIYLVIIVPIVATIYLFFYVIAATRKSERVAREIRDA